MHFAPKEPLSTFSDGRQFKTMWFILILISLLSVIAFVAMGQESKNSGPVQLQFTALDGRKVDLSKLRGKVVLIDCWATWCGPCLKEMAHIREVYEKYHVKGFEVIGISMDDATAKARVETIIKNKNIPWPQRFEGKGINEDSFKKAYNIKSLPTVFLIDKEGNLVDTNARGERLEQLLEKYL